MDDIIIIYLKIITLHLLDHPNKAEAPQTLNKFIGLCQPLIQIFICLVFANQACSRSMTWAIRMRASSRAVSIPACARRAETTSMASRTVPVASGMLMPFW